MSSFQHDCYCLMGVMSLNRYIPRFLDYGYDEIWVCAHLDDDDLVQLGIIEKADR